MLVIIHSQELLCASAILYSQQHDDVLCSREWRFYAPLVAFCLRSQLTHVVAAVRGGGGRRIHCVPHHHAAACWYVQYACIGVICMQLCLDPLDRSSVILANSL